jgi:hypothetical protein
MRLEFDITVGSAAADRIKSNVAHARSLGLPYVARRASGRALNVIGRGPSVADHIEQLRRDDADNWAAGTAWAWCRDNEIPATFVCVDAQPRMADYVAGCSSAILHPQCDPALFAALSDADVKLVAPEAEEFGSTSATQAAFLGAVLGYEVRLFGCEGSYAQTTHVNEDVPQPNEMFIRADGRVFRTNTQMLVQSEQFARIICMTTRPLFVDRSGGLLAALIASGGEWDFERWDNAPEWVGAAIASERNTGNPGWGDDGAADWQARAAE